jgi:hypothetical protein
MAQRFRCVPLDAPMGFDIDAFRCCRAFPRRPDQLDVSPCERARVASPDPNVVGKAKCFGFVWLLASDARLHPEGRERNRSRRAPAPSEEGASAASKNPEGSEDAGGSTPKGGSTPSAPWHPKALGLRRIASDPRRDLSRFSAHPEGWHRWFELVLPSLARSPAHLWKTRSPPTSDARRRGHQRATRARVPKDDASNTSLGPPKESQRKGESFGHPKVVR